MKNSYWTKNGKYQKQSDLLSIFTSNGYTQNKFLDAYICMCYIYHDVYNNGYGANVEMYDTEFRERVLSIVSKYKNFRGFKDSSSFDVFYEDLNYLEDILNYTLLVAVVKSNIAPVVLYQTGEIYQFEKTPDSREYIFKNMHDASCKIQTHRKAKIGGYRL